jgi:exosortase/archaeosortase family protein
MVGWPCTSYANASLALLLWLVVTRSMRPRPVRSEWLYLALVFVSVLALNSIRLALIVRSRAMYVLYHGPFGETLFNALMIAATLAVTAYGLRRELLR